MTEKKLVKNLVQNDSIDTYFSVKYKHPIKTYKNGFMFSVGLADRSGEIEATYWGTSDESKTKAIFNSFAVSDVIRVKGRASLFNEKLRVDINEGQGQIKKCEPTEYDLEEFIPKTNQNIDEMWAFILSIKDSIKQPALKALLDSFCNDAKFVEAFKKTPGAMYYHHACIGGLLEHTYGVIKILETIKELHPSMDRDLMMAGGILHDVGKIAEFEVTTNIKVSEVGMLQGHISLGEEMVRERIKKITDFTEPLKSKFLHIILSHHGKGDYGSPKDPQFPEAVAVHLADLLDSQLTMYIRAKKDANTEDFRTYLPKLGEIYLK